MSGHSKWSTIKHAKGAADVVKGRVFTRAARAISIAVAEGGGDGDPDHNFHLRLAIEKAREVNVPKENIKRAIEKGKGIGGSAMQQIMYEAYGPHGVAILIETATDNKQRTVSVIKNLFDRTGSTLAAQGAVSYLFTRCGVITAPKVSHTMDDILEAALEAGADDVVETSDMFEIYTHIGVLMSVAQKLRQKGIVLDNTESIMRANMPVSYDEKILEHVNVFLEELEGLDDVQKVFTNIGD